MARLPAKLRDRVSDGVVYAPNIDLRGESLRKCKLTHACLDGANLSSVDFFGANLDMASLRGANFRGAKNIAVFPNIGSRGDTLYAVRHSRNIIMFKTGCFWGSEREFLKAVGERHGPAWFNIYAKEYSTAVKKARRKLLGK